MSTSPANDLRILYLIALVVATVLIVGMLTAGAIVATNLASRQASQSRTASCQFAYAARLTDNLHKRAALNEGYRTRHASAATINAGLARFPIPPVPHCPH